MSYENHRLHKLGDGTIVLYTRNGGRTFHARVKIYGVSGYARIASTQKRVVSEAYAVAKRWYEDAKQGRVGRRLGDTWRAKEGSARRFAVSILRHRGKN